MAKKKQKGNGAGTVYPRKNKAGKFIGYRGSYWVNGKRRYVSAKKKGDAEKLLRQAMSDADRGLGQVTILESPHRPIHPCDTAQGAQASRA